MSQSNARTRTWLANPAAIYTGTDQQSQGGLLIEGNQIIELIVAGQQPDSPYDLKVDLSDRVLIPGLINTHHHFYQTLTRALPAALNKELFP